MQSLLAAVGLGTQGLRKQGSATSAVWSSEEASLHLSGNLLPDFVAVAAATEQGIVKLEEEARSLEFASLQEALTLLRRWSQALRRRPRADEPLASFKAQFLRSRVLEKSLEAVRRNEKLRQVLLSTILTGSGTEQCSSRFSTDSLEDSCIEKSRPEDLAVELSNLLQLCLPKAAGPLVKPVLSAAVGDVPTDFVAAALAAVRKLKEDWTEVVRSQATRGLERRLDSLDYKLQKSVVAQGSSQESRHAITPGLGESAPAGMTASAGVSWQASHDHVVVLANLCEALSASRSQAENRACELSDTLRVLGSAAKGYVYNGSERDLPSKADCEAAIAAMVRRNVPGMQQGLRLLGLPHEPLLFTPGSELKLCGCDIRDAVNDMMAHWVEEDMDRFYGGLQQIQLRLLSSGDGCAPMAASCDLASPDTAKSKLKDSGFLDIDAIEASSIIPADRPRDRHHSFLPLESTSPSRTVQRLNLLMAGKPDVEGRSALLARRAAVAAERQEFLDRIRALDDELNLIDEQLKQSRLGVPTHPARHASMDTMDEKLSSSPREIPRELEFSPPARKAAAALSPAKLHLPQSSAMPLVQDLQCQLADVAEAVTGESQRTAERLRMQQQHRRAQLLTGLASYLECEATQVSAFDSVASSHDQTSKPSCSSRLSTGMSPAELVSASSQRVRAVSKRVETALLTDAWALGHAAVRLWPQVLTAGSRCRAKWVDGNHYDAEVQCILGDGAVLVNWLRPQVEDTLSVQDSNTDAGNKAILQQQPLVTVSESGGDDTCHRIIPRDEVHLVGRGCLRDPPEEVLAAQSLFRARHTADLVCVDCGRDGTNWASISFGTYVCDSCAEEHCRLGPRLSLMRSLDDGWGWPKHDLEPLRLGGNAAFRADESFPAVQNLPLTQRYMTRFAEHYRKQLDARCAGCAPPPALMLDVASSPLVGEFLTVCEAVAVAQHAMQRFEAAAQDAQRKLPVMLPRSGTGQMPSSLDESCSSERL